MNAKPSAVVLSPHLDDAVFSLGGMLGKGYFKEICVVSVFTQSRYTIDGVRTEAEVTSLRHSEDSSALTKIEAEQVLLGFRDSSLRSEYESEESYMDPLIDTRKDSAWKSLDNKLSSFFEDRKFDVVFCPLALGGHIDHRMVFEWSLQAGLENDIAFYEDIGYQATNSDDLILEKVAELPQKFSPVCLDIGNLAKKLALMNCYSSQISDEIVDQVSSLVSIRFGERVWVQQDSWLARNYT